MLGPVPLRAPSPYPPHWPHPCISLRPTSCPRPFGSGSTSFAKLGSPRPWQEVPSWPAPTRPSLASHGGHQRPLHPRGRRNASALALSGLPSPQPLRLSSFNLLPGVDSFCAPLPPLVHHPLHGRRKICPFQKLFPVPQLPPLLPLLHRRHLGNPASSLPPGAHDADLSPKSLEGDLQCI